ncbi:MAG: SDR family oxidoreductase [Anaerolineae bacterium]|nr:SDR family oxidoreductase [Anaerolineae bacterium]
MSKTMLVTGAAKGIGRATAIGMAERGYDVAVNDLPSEMANLDSLAKQIQAKGQRALIVPADISVKKQVQEMVQTVLKAWKTLDVLVNNAGILTVNYVEDMPEEIWDKIFAVNAKGTFLVTQAVIPHMKARHMGRIIHIASIGGKQGAPGQAHYCASKAAIIEFTRVLAMELGECGITVNAVCPGIILTEMGRNNLGTQENIDRWTSATALKRLGEPEDVVGSVAFLASEDSAYITGQSLNVCGGIVYY